MQEKTYSLIPNLDEKQLCQLWNAQIPYENATLIHKEGKLQGTFVRTSCLAKLKEVLQMKIRETKDITYEDIQIVELDPIEQELLDSTDELSINESDISITPSPQDNDKNFLEVEIEEADLVPDEDEEDSDDEFTVDYDPDFDDDEDECLVDELSIDFEDDDEDDDFSEEEIDDLLFEEDEEYEEMADVMQEIAEFEYKTQKETPLMDAATKLRELQEKRKQEKTKFVAISMDRLMKNFAVTAAKIEKKKAKVAQLQDQLRKAIIETNGQQKKLAQLTQELCKQKDTFSDEFEKASRVSGVTNIEVSDHTIRCSLAPIACEDPRTGLLHNFGKHILHIDLAKGRITKWEQVPDENIDSPAPYIGCDGLPVLSTKITDELIPEALAGNCVADAITMAIAFLKTVDVSDPFGSAINLWPLAK